MRPLVIAVALLAILGAHGAAHADPSPPLPTEDDTPSRLSLGIRLGLGVSGLSGLEASPDVRSSKLLVPAMAVGGVAVGWLGALGLQGEVLLVRRGAEAAINPEPDAVDVVYVDVNLQLTYLDVDLLARLQPSRTGELRPFAVLGPSLSVVLDSDSESGDGPFDVSPFDAALIGGVGLGIGPAHRGFTAEVRAAIGLLDVSDEPGDDFTVRNRTFLALVGYER